MSIFRHPVTVPSTVVGLLCLVATFLVGVPIVVSVVVIVVVVAAATTTYHPL